jgi:hypothetical protein
MDKQRTRNMNPGKGNQGPEPIHGDLLQWMMCIEHRLGQFEISETTGPSGFSGPENPAWICLG